MENRKSKWGRNWMERNDIVWRSILYGEKDLEKEEDILDKNGKMEIMDRKDWNSYIWIVNVGWRYKEGNDVERIRK